MTDPRDTGTEVPTWLAGLNPAQLDAARVVDGPALILAGAGSGKTRVIVHRIAHLIQGCQVDPGKILAVTFTNKAAEEMKERVERLLGYRAGPVWLGTFHRFGAWVLRAHIDRLGYKREFVIYDETDQLSLIKKVLKERGMGEDFEPRRVRAWIEEIKRTGRTDLKDGPSDIRTRTLWPVLQDYQQRLFDSGAVDFSDLLLLTYKLFEKFPDVLEQYRERFHYIMVDEYQDTNRIQYLLVLQLTGKRHNLFVVGDEDQSIYGWRGADIANILNFEHDFPETRVVLLEQNYRSTQTIIESAGELIGRNLERKKKKLWTQNPVGEKVVVYAALDEREEARWVVEEIRRQRGLGRRLPEMAVFYRTHAQSRPLEDALRAANLNYSVYGGPRFYDRKEVKDILAYLRLLQNPDDEVSLLRIINVPARGIGDRTVAAVVALKRERSLSWSEAMRSAVEDGVAGRSGGKLLGFVKLMDELRGPEANLKVLVESVIIKSGYRAMLEAEDTVESLSRQENLSELLNAVADYAERAEGPTLDGFLEQVSLASEIDKFDPDAGAVSLMTLHSAKGLEFPVVFMVGMVEGLFPHSRCLSEEADGVSGADEEERRLAYVGMTRARELLHLTWSESILERGQRKAAGPSRFLTEIPVRYLRQVGRRGVLRTPEPRDERYKPPIDELFNVGPGASRLGPQPRKKNFGDSEIVFDVPEPEEQESRPTADGARFKPGDRVYHRDHGEGVVRRFEDSGDKSKIVIRFPHGSKKFLAKYVKLEPLD